MGELLTAMIWPQMLQSECRQQHPGAGQANGTDTHPGDVARNCDARPTQCSIVHPRAACLISTGFLSCSHHVRVAPAAAGSGGCGNRRRRLVLGAGCGVDAMPCLEGRRAAMLECISLHAANFGQRRCYECGKLDCSFTVACVLDSEAPLFPCSAALQCSSMMPGRLARAESCPRPHEAFT